MLDSDFEVDISTERYYSASSITPIIVFYASVTHRGNLYESIEVVESEYSLLAQKIEEAKVELFNKNLDTLLEI